MSVVKANFEVPEEFVFDRADYQRRFDAFWGKLDENRRGTLRGKPYSRRTRDSLVISERTSCRKGAC